MLLLEEQLLLLHYFCIHGTAPGWLKTNLTKMTLLMFNLIRFNYE